MQIKVVELENAGGGKLQELEKTLLETRITNARLMEDNESFQLLLSEKTLNGDFSKTDVMHNSSGLGSLAEELESAEGESENYRRLDLEAKSLREQNKALSLYVESIIGRLLQHKEFENVLEKNPDLMSGKARPPSPGNTNKELPPPPPPKDDEPQPTSFLQRARSVVAGPRKARPVSQIASPVTPTSTPPIAPTAEAPNEDFSTARNIPITRPQAVRDTHRRSQSDMPAPIGAAPLVTHMYRGPPSGGSPLMSPRLSPSVGSAAGARSSFFPPSASTTGTTTTSRVASGSALNTSNNPGSSSNSTFSDRSNPNNNNNNNDKVEVGSASSPPRSSGGGLGPQYGGAVMTQNRLRPLRLVQENVGEGTTSEEEREREKARKKANRGSWMPGWMNRGVSGGAGGDGAAF